MLLEELHREAVREGNLLLKQFDALSDIDHIFNDLFLKKYRVEERRPVQQNELIDREKRLAAAGAKTHQLVI